MVKSGRKETLDLLNPSAKPLHPTIVQDMRLAHLRTQGIGQPEHPRMPLGLGLGPFRRDPPMTSLMAPVPQLQNNISPLSLVHI